MPIDRNSAQYITGATYKPTQTSAPGVWDLDDQANNVSKNLWPLPPSAIQRSLRFNRADSTVLTRTPTVAGNRRTWSWSGWFKTSALLNANYHLFDTQPSATYTGAYITSTGALEFRDWQSGSFVWVLTTSTLYRDPSAWYHVVFVHDTTQPTASDRIKIYVNGTQVTQFSTATYPSLNYQSNYNNTVIQYLGGFDGTTNGGFTGFIAEVNSIDGQALTPASFAETDPQTGVWIPKRYTGTYGTNGFRLSFANNSSITALGYDSSGQGNNWTPNNFSITPGVGNDVFVDVPSLYGTDTGLGNEVLGNYCTINTLMQNTSVATISDGALRAVTGTTGVSSAYIGTIGFNSGKWYWEVHVEAIGTNNMWIGVTKNQANRTVDAYLNTWTYNKLGQKTDNSATGSTYGATYTSGDIIGVAVDADAGSITFYKNGVSQGIAFTGLNMSGGVYTIAGSDNSATMVFNFGQRPFTYAAPSGYKALCTTNLPAPAIGQTSSNQADNHFATITYTGNGGTQTISTLDFQPDLVWIKNRTGANSHILVDSIRGVGKGISSEAATGEYSIPTDFQSFNSNGFTVGYGGTNITNASANNYVAWCWRAATTTVVNTTGTITTNVRANQTSRFSIVRYTGNNGSSQTIGHGLNAIPDMIIVKNLDSTNANWVVYHKSLGSSSNLLLLNTTGTVLNIANYWGSNLPTNSVFGVGDGGGWDNNTNTHRHIAYCWAEVPGYSAFGSYTGNGSSDGPFVYLGFRPRWIMVKQSAGTSAASGSWQIFDTARDLYNPSDYRLQANSSGIEGTGAPSWDVLSNGFKLRSSNTNWNETSGTYVYAAFAETPARLSTAR